MVLEKLEKKELDVLIGFLIAVIVVIAIAFASFYPTTPEKFSEVFLGENHAQAKTNQPYTVQFQIKNHEGQPMTYSYQVVGQETKEGKVTLTDGADKTVQEEILFNSAGQEKEKVSIEVWKEGSEAEPFLLWFWVKVEE